MTNRLWILLTLTILLCGCVEKSVAGSNANECDLMFQEAFQFLKEHQTCTKSEECVSMDMCLGTCWCLINQLGFDEFQKIQKEIPSKCYRLRPQVKCKGKPGEIACVKGKCQWQEGDNS
jgi:hypothetical protein